MNDDDRVRLAVRKGSSILGPIERERCGRQKVREHCEAGPNVRYRAADKPERVVCAKLFRHERRLDRRAWRVGRNSCDNANGYRPDRGRELPSVEPQKGHQP